LFVDPTRHESGSRVTKNLIEHVNITIENPGTAGSPVAQTLVFAAPRLVSVPSAPQFRGAISKRILRKRSHFPPASPFRVYDSVWRHLFESVHQY
jgi:hypothetical protein